MKPISLCAIIFFISAVAFCQDLKINFGFDEYSISLKSEKFASKKSQISSNLETLDNFKEISFEDLKTKIEEIKKEL